MLPQSIILCWYRPTASDRDNESFNALERILKRLDSEDKELIIIGDTNCNLTSKTDRNTKRIKTLYDLFHFKQQIRDCTRVASITNENGEKLITKSLIDHFATSREKSILEAESIKLGMVDHY